ncbi:MAG: hypothetical protein LBE56_06115 [Tannerella sp.]|jgi:hypothetical protein|nr:hypothetical protein [Tannerella sp.]
MRKLLTILFFILNWVIQVTDSLGNLTPYYHRNGLVTRHVETNGGEWTANSTVKSN